MTEAWYPEATTRIETRACGPAIGPVKGVCVHIAQGYIATMENWAKMRGEPGQAGGSPKKSSHFGIKRNGDITQFVSLNNRSWAAGRLDRGAPPTWSGYTPGVNPNANLIHVECEGFAEDPVSYGYDYIYGAQHPWPSAVLDSLARVSAWSLFQYGLEANGETLTGHYTIAPRSRANDPGPAFKWHPFRAHVTNLLDAMKPPAPVAPAPEQPNIAIPDVVSRIEALEHSVASIQNWASGFHKD